MPVPCVIVLGGPGSGKGTQCALLAEILKARHVSVGALMRQERDSGSELGKIIQETDAKGVLLGSDVVLKVLEKDLVSGDECEKVTVLLDGFPRTVENLEAFRVWPVCEVKGVLAIDVPDDVLAGRLLSRGKAGSGRWDDQDESVVRNRIAKYHEQSVPVETFYSQEGKLVRVDGTRTIPQVTAAAVRGLTFKGVTPPGPWKDMVLKICFTGGPCGGKTTAIKKVQEHLEGLGFHVLVTPEAATMALTSGATLAGLGEKSLQDWETALLNIVTSLEDNFERMGRATASPSVLLCDRGTMDVRAHITPAMWESVVGGGDGTPCGSLEALRDLRYDHVFHLVSTAVDAPELYTTEGNAARSNGLTWARDLDARCEGVWKDHPGWQRFASGDNKFRDVEEAAARVLQRFQPPRLPLRLLMTAEPFGFGPTTAIAQLFPYLRDRVETIDFLGQCHTPDVQRPLPYDNVTSLTEGPKGYEELKELALERKYDVAVVSCDFEAARVLRSVGVSVAIYDPLTWYWKEIPTVCYETELYLSQLFFKVKERINGKDFQQVALIPPIITLPRVPEKLERTRALLNLGGLRNPFMTAEQCGDYACLLVDTLLPVLQSAGLEVDIITSAGMVNRLKPKYPQSKTVTPPEAQHLLLGSHIAIMTPGLGNIFEASALSSVTVWLPPANDSQGQQLVMLREKGMCPNMGDWHELLSVDPIIYTEEQSGVMERIATAIKLATHPDHVEGFTRQMQGVAKRALKSHRPAQTSLHTLVKVFGINGAPAAASAVRKLLLDPMYQRHVEMSG